MTVQELIEILIDLHEPDLPIVVETWDNRSVDKVILGYGCVILETEELD